MPPIVLIFLHTSFTQQSNCLPACQVKKRFLSGAELLASHALPTTSEHARLSGTPRLQIDSITQSNMVRMSGNGMSLPCVGCMILACVLGLEKL